MNTNPFLRAQLLRASSFFSRLISSVTSSPLAFYAPNLFFPSYSESWPTPRR